MNSLRVSFVLPVYNAEAYVGQAVQSVLAQSFGDFELLAINDGSRDGSRDVLASIKDERLRVIDQPNSGLVSTLNRGIREARGELIARMDADDICLPDRLRAQVDFLDKHEDYALVGGWVSTIDEEGELLSSVVCFPQAHEDLWATIGRRPWVMCHPAVVFRRSAAVSVGLYDPAYKHAEDTEFFARLMTRHRAANLPEVVLRYRLRRTAVSSEFADHGVQNARLVRRVIDRWTPGEPFVATAVERSETDAVIGRGVKRLGPKPATSLYYNRCGRELLRDGRWRRAAASYLKVLSATPFNAEAYKGLAAALCRIGAAPKSAREDAQLVLRGGVSRPIPAVS